MPKIVDHDAYRLELLEGGFSLFARKGYRAVSMRGLAKELKVSTGTLYHYFETKEDFFEQIVRQVASRTVLDAIAGMPPESSASERLDTLLRFIEAAEPQLQQFISIIIEYRRHSESESAAAVIEESLGEYRSAIVAQLIDADPSVADFVLTAIIGVLTHRMIRPSPPPFEADAEHLRRALGPMLGISVPV